MDIPNLTISKLHQGYKVKEYSVTEVVKSYLDGIKKLNPLLNAYLTITTDAAVDRATELDKRLKDNPGILSKLPLFGVPVGLKDLYLTKGIRTTAASKVLDDYIPQYSATAWERLESSGAVLLGKLNCDAWAHGSSGENSDYGSTKNPWNLEYVPGGSSSGSAAALAADMALITTGTDTGGSIRLPASFCGVTGLKPTYGRVPRYGVIAMASSLDTVGHFGKSVEDVAKVLEVTAGQDARDATTPDQAVVDYVQNLKLSKKITIGLPEEYFGDGIDREVAKLLEDAIAVYKDLGVNLKSVKMPHTRYATAVYYIVQPSEVSSNLARYDGIRYGLDRGQFGDEAIRRIMLGTYTLSAGYYDAYYKKAMQVRTLIKRDFDQVFEEVDLLFTPVSPSPAFKLGEKTADPLQMYLSDIFSITANLAGVPGLAVPSGFTNKGLPVGFQLLGPHFSEELLFQVGHLYQKNTSWHLQKPRV